MNVVNQLWTRVSSYYRTLNPATLSGAIDIIVVKQPDGTLQSSPFHARFGKSGILRPQDNVVELYVNDELIPDIQMQLGEAGEAFFLEEVHETSDVSGQDDHQFNLEIHEEVRPQRQQSQDAGNQSKDDDSGSDGSVDSDSRPYMSYYSDCEGDERLYSGPSTRRGTMSGYKSDSDLDADLHPHKAILGAADQLAAQLDWEWGKLPKSATVDSMKSGDYFDCSEESNTTIDETDKLTGERYLSELDERNRHLYLSGFPKSPESGYKSDRSEFEVSLEDDLNAGVRLSLCGGLDSPREVTTDRFLQHLVSYEEFVKNPDIIDHKDLVVRIQGKNYNWKAAAPLLLCRAAFGLALPHKAEVALRQRHMVHRRKRNVMRSWFTWGGGTGEEFGDDDDWQDSGLDGDVPRTNELTQPLNLSRTLPAEVKEGIAVAKRKLAKSMRLTSDQLLKLNLKPGYNELRYSITTKYQGTTACTCGIYLWNHDDRIVVSDIDGTITKSDVLGHILPMVGKDWTQPQIVRLFSAIERNDYKFVYLSARAIGQSAVTRRFLQRVRQEGLPLPDAPVLLSPLSLLRAFHQEVIARRPEIFKIACLKDVRALFPSTTQPFWAGFGNRPSDTVSYSEVGIPCHRCFLVNPQGEVMKEKSSYLPSSYQALSEVADLIFPPHRHVVEECDYSHFQYWREPLPNFQPVPLRCPDVDCDNDMLP